MKTLRLPLKKKWFEMTKSGEKTEDYREINEYWLKRLINESYKEFYSIDEFIIDLKCFSGANRRVKCYRKLFTQTTLTLGYPKNNDTEKIIHFEHKGITVGYGNPEWGAEKGKLYFVIKHGKKIEKV